MVDAADRHGVDKFVLISTDKAVNPTSVMGASKRVCEMLLQARARTSRTRYVAVRFGNVLGSDGSVIPLFQRQLERGGPITVTHPEARRYFMTIPEAVRLTLQAAAMGRGGEVFLLDMGEQVRIVDLARQLIRMSGLREGQDVEIVFTGLRAGEKLYEELHSAAEHARMTRHERVLRWELDAPDEPTLRRGVDELCALAANGDAEAIRRKLGSLVPEYRESNAAAAPHGPASEVVELPVSAAEHPQSAARRGAARTALEATVALALLVLSAPLWGWLWLEALGRGERRILVMGLGATAGQPVPGGPGAAGGPVAAGGASARARVRFRSDLGPVSRWAARRRLDRVPSLLDVVRGDTALTGGPRDGRAEKRFTPPQP